jgi:hypothetical protein
LEVAVEVELLLYEFVLVGSEVVGDVGGVVVLAFQFAFTYQLVNACLKIGVSCLGEGEELLDGDWHADSQQEPKNPPLAHPLVFGCGEVFAVDLRIEFQEVLVDDCHEEGQGEFLDDCHLIECERAIDLQLLFEGVDQTVDVLLADEVFVVEEEVRFEAELADPRLYEIGVEVEQLWEDVYFCASPFVGKLDYFGIQLFGGDVLIAVCCCVEFQSLLLKLYHYLCNGAFGEGVGFLLLHCGELLEEGFEFSVNGHVEI